MKHIKVVHISRGYGDYVISLANQLAGMVNLYVVLAKSDAWMENHLSREVRIIKSGAPRVSSIRNSISMMPLAYKVKKINPDIIHYQSGVIWEGLFPRLFTKAKAITTVHDVVHHPHQMRNQFTPQFFIDRLAKRTDGLIVHGECLKEMAKTRFDISDAEYMHRIGVVDHPIISRYGIGQASEKAGTNILFFGGLAQWKGIEVLLPAMEALSLKLPSAVLRIAGPSSMPDYYRGLPYQGKNVQWDIRRQSDEEVENLFRWADIVVLPYIEASQSGVLHIAQSFGVPVVATAVGALAESIKNEINGLLIKPNDASELTSAMYRLMLDTELREKIISNIVHARDSELQKNSIGCATLNFYRELCKS